MIGLEELVRRRVGSGWSVGVITGPQGSGKTTAALEAWGDDEGVTVIDGGDVPLCHHGKIVVVTNSAVPLLGKHTPDWIISMPGRTLSVGARLK